MKDSIVSRLWSPLLPVKIRRLNSILTIQLMDKRPFYYAVQQDDYDDRNIWVTFFILPIFLSSFSSTLLSLPFPYRPLLYICSSIHSYPYIRRPLNLVFLYFFSHDLCYGVLFPDNMHRLRFMSLGEGICLSISLSFCQKKKKITSVSLLYIPAFPR